MNLSIAIAVSVNIEPKKLISLIDSVITQGTLNVLFFYHILLLVLVLSANVTPSRSLKMETFIVCRKKNGLRNDIDVTSMM